MLGSLDFDDAETTIDATPLSGFSSEPELGLPPAPARQSYIRLRPTPPSAELARFVDRLHDEQISLMVDLVCVEHSVAEAEKLVPEAVAPLRRLVADLTDVRAAMSELLSERMPRPLVTPSTTLGVYLQGVFVWCANVNAALNDYLAELVAGRGDVGELRARLRLAAQTHFDALGDDIIADVVALKIVHRDSRDDLEAFHDRLDELLWTTQWLGQRLASL